MLNHKITGEGMPVVLLHPVGLDLTSWDAVQDDLSADHKVLSLDLRGHGKSLWVEGASSLEDFADDVSRLLSELRFGPVAVVGLSFGGMLAQTLAIAHPYQVSALIACGCGDTLAPALRPMMLERGRKALANGMEVVVEETLERWFTPDFRKAGGDAATRARLLHNDVRAWAASWQAISGLDMEGKLAALRIPALAVAGELDLAFPVAAVRKVAADIPGARFAVLPGAPHMMQIEQPDALLALIRDFLASCP